MFNKFLGKKDSPQKDGAKQSSPKSINSSSQVKMKLIILR